VGAAAPVLPGNAALLLYIVAKAAQAAILAGRSTPPLLLLLWAAGAPLTAELLLGLAVVPLDCEMLLLGLAEVPPDCEAPPLLATCTVVDPARPGGLPLLLTPAALLIGCPVTMRVARREPDTGC
jgi:hypothetical protein